MDSLHTDENTSKTIFCVNSWHENQYLTYGTFKNFGWLKVTGRMKLASLTGWPKSKFPFSNGYNSENKLFWPHVDKAKMHLRGGRIFQFSKFCLHFLAVCSQFFKKNKKKKNLPPLKHILALSTWGQKSFVSELQPFEKGNFDLSHPVSTNY